MKVAHIVPAAFNYFDDIRNTALGLVSYLSEFDIEAEVFTVNYGTIESKDKAASPVKAGASKGKYKGLVGIKSALQIMQQCDLLHVHTPLLGAASKVLAWKKKHKNTPLVVTYYRKVKVPDVFSLITRWYNSYNLPKLFAAANLITCFSFEDFKKNGGFKYLKDNSKLIEVDSSTNFLGDDLTTNVDKVKLKQGEWIAYKYAIVYNTLLESGSNNN
jgi:hypothetical protein